MSVKPMLAVKATDLDALPYPLLASTKLDGIRCLITPDGPQTRRGDLVPNDHIRGLLAPLPVGLDGEIVCRDKDGKVDFRATTGNVRRKAGTPAFEYAVFDDWNHKGPFKTRWEWATAACLSYEILHPGSDWLCPLEQSWVDSAEDVRRHFLRALERGNEGLILRQPWAYYKHGRATERSADMLKVKPYEDSEAVIVGVFEREHNTNEAQKDALGHTKRANTKDAKAGMSMLGGFICMSLEGYKTWQTMDDAARTPNSPSTFKVSAGNTDQMEKAKLWARRDKLVGRVIRFQHVTVGGYDKPRHGTFQGFREAWDMG